MHIRSSIIHLFAAALLLLPAAHAADQPGVILAKTRAATGAPLPYLLYLPSGYNTDAGARFPLVVCLHGTGEVGDGSTDGTLTESGTNQLARVLHAGPLDLVRTGATYFSENPAIIIQPQAPTASWNHVQIDDTITQVMNAYRVDADRLYVTGYSLGGGGTWVYGLNHSARVAALAPVAGASYPMTNYAYGNLKDIPIWATHCSNDNGVPTAWTTGVQTGFLGTVTNGWAGGIARSIAASSPSYACLDSHPDHPTVTIGGKTGLDAIMLAGVTATRSASYHVGSGWSWKNGMVSTAGDRLQLTIFNGGGHSGWDQTYGADGASINRPFWDWLLAQRRGQAAVVAPADVIVDNADANTAKTGAWGTNPNANAWKGAFAFAGTGATYFSFLPALPRASRYAVSIWYTNGTNRAAAVPVAVTIAGVTTIVTIDERTNGGRWVSLGTWNCPAGGASSVTVQVAGTTGVVVADAVRFLEVPIGGAG